MEYLVFEKSLFIDTMDKPEEALGSVFQFTGSDALIEIGLDKKFWFKCNYGFSNNLPISENQSEIVSPQNDYQQILSIFLDKCIRNKRLTGQFE